jgi:hypothetical protein
MKLGIAISVAIVAVLGLLYYFMAHGVPDVITKQTNERVLQKVSLDSSLPTLYVPLNPGDDAGEVYLKAIRLYNRNQASLTRETPPKALVADVASVILDAMDAGTISKPFLDDQIPIKTGASPQFGGALEGLHTVLALEAQNRLERGDKAGVLRVAQATHLFGHRLFENCVRLYPRRTGLEMMESALGWMAMVSEFLEGGRDKVSHWNTAVGKVRDNWNIKVPLVHSVKPHIGDLLNVAKNDKDVTYRIEAMLHLGVAKFNPGNRSNLRAIEHALEEASKDADQQIAAAAKAAKAFTVEELRKLH